MKTQCILGAALGALLLVAAPALAATGDDVLINEVLGSTTGSDSEFVELIGTPGYVLDGLSIIVVESDDQSSNGTIDKRVDLGASDKIGSNGYFLIANSLAESTYSVTANVSFSSNSIENSSYTIALVETSSLSGTTVTGSETVLDAVAVTDGEAASFFHFGAPVLGPDGSYLPAGVRRLANGVDTDTAADWGFSDFNNSTTINTPTAGDTAPPPPPALKTIMEIQGSGQRSPLEGTDVRTRGVVTLIRPSGWGFWLQDPDGDSDATTSDGIYVNGSAGSAEVGDHVQVHATVEEQQFDNALPLTRLVGVTGLTVLGQETVPTPVLLANQPDVSIPKGIAFWEPLEGMLVQIQNGTVVSATSRFGEFAILTRKDANPGSGYEPSRKVIRIRTLGGNKVDYNPERILVDDYSLSGSIVVYPGDRVKSLVGVVDYSFGNYKLQPKSFDIKSKKQPKRPSPAAPWWARSSTAIATFNVENLFDLIDNPDKDDGSSTPTAQELETQLKKLTKAVIDELKTPAILVVQEVENETILQELGDRVNLCAGTSYKARSFETSDGRGIECGFLYDTKRVRAKAIFQLTDSHVSGVSAAFGPSSASPGREPIVGVFRFGCDEIVIIGNHFKSKGGDDPIFGVNWPPVRVTETQRKAQATVVRAFVDKILKKNPLAKVMVTGDLNDFEFGEPGEGKDHPLAILEGTGWLRRMWNLVKTVKPAERWTYNYDGNCQVLDHMLVSPALLLRLRGVSILHFNASFPASLGENSKTPLRSSDHDPIVGYFRLK
jgi:predicted extracellular nuclease